METRPTACFYRTCQERPSFTAEVAEITEEEQAFLCDLCALRGGLRRADKIDGSSIGEGVA